MRVLVILLLATAIGVAQAPAKSAGTALPTKLNDQLKTITERQNALAKAYQELDAQKIIIVQRAALELHLTAEQVDQMELFQDTAGNFLLRPKIVPDKEKPK